MLQLKIKNNAWTPPPLSEGEIYELLARYYDAASDRHQWLVFLRIRPYIDAIYVDYCLDGSRCADRIERFTFRDGYVWSSKEEEMFETLCLNNVSCGYKYGFFDEIFDYYSEAHPDWHLKRYYTDSIRMLDHIYHCMRRGTVKELLYKSGLDKLAKYSGNIDELDLLSTSPSEIYGNLPVRVLRAMNCEAGGRMLCEKRYRDVIRLIAAKYSSVFDSPMNDAQCEYIGYLKDKDLSADETGRLYLSRRKELAGFWNPRMYKDFLCKVRGLDRLSHLKEIDPIYGRYLVFDGNNDRDIAELDYYLLNKRQEYDRYVRVSNRKRDQSWQERDHGYVIRYPQTINDFCRESVYMKNCLIGYVDAFIHNSTTILFMRKTDSVNTPFITIEVYNNSLQQAYHRFNEPCSDKEIEWIRGYCDRHGIRYIRDTIEDEITVFD